MDQNDFNFLSISQLEKLAYHKPVEELAMSDFTQFEIAHGATAPFVPSVRYTLDGTNWYFDGDSPTGSAYIVGKAWANNTTLRLQFISNPGNKTIKYEVYGMARNV